MTAPVSVITISAGAHQIPIELCQLKSRARPESRRLGTATARSEPGRFERGHQRNTPLIAMPRNARLATPVNGRPISREPSQRCQSSTAWSAAPSLEPLPRTAPEYGSTYNALSRPNPTRTLE